MSDTTETRNALADEKSPFLQHGATQPVEWQPWGQAAFERAKRENRPVLLDIGAVWCHWCHVMDHESYENDDTARLINEQFVPVKVDRDERPDVDARYQRAVQMLTGQGGWPLTAFLTPDGDVFYGGTYFPPADAHGRPSFRRVLNEVSRVWREEPERAAEAARGIGERLHAFAEAEAAPGEPSAAVVDDTLEELAHSYDFRHGGFGRAPKFPNAGALDLLIDRFLEDETDWALRISADSLKAMARGGVYDQLAGGFHRYSTDARWIIPHFEKMAYDNGTLLETYARAHATYENPLYRRTAEGIVAYYQDVSADLVRNGGFPASQDADFGSDNDGDYWTWTEDELRDALDDDALAETALLHFGFDDPATAMHLDSSRHVLYRRFDAEEIARRTGVTEDVAADRIEEARRRLKAARDTRPRPYVDETLYTGWVALVASGHVAAARYLELEEAGASAIRALDRLFDEGFDPEHGIAHRLGDRAAGETLEDHALVAKACIDAFEWTQDERHLERARAILDVTANRFRDPGGAFRDRPHDADTSIGPMSQPHFPIADAPVPSGNGSLFLALLRMFALTGETRWQNLALSGLRAFAGSAPRLGAGACTLIKAIAWATMPVTTVVVVHRNDKAGLDLLGTAIATPRPRTVVRAYAADAIVPDALPAAIRAMLTGDAPRAYVCVGSTCARPVRGQEALHTLLREFRGA